MSAHIYTRSLFLPPFMPTTNGIVIGSFVGLLGLVFHDILLMGLVSLLGGFAFWRRYLLPTTLNIPLQKDTFVPKNTLSFISTEFLFSQF